MPQLTAASFRHGRGRGWKRHTRSPGKPVTSGGWLIAWNVAGIGRVCSGLGAHAEARPHIVESIESFTSLGDETAALFMRGFLVITEWALGNREPAARVLGTMEGLRRHIGVENSSDHVFPSGEFQDAAIRASAPRDRLWQPTKYAFAASKHFARHQID